MDCEDSSITGGVNLRAWRWKYRPFLPSPPFVRVIGMKIGLPPRRMSPDESVIVALSPHMLNGRWDGWCIKVVVCFTCTGVGSVWTLLCSGSSWGAGTNWVIFTRTNLQTRNVRTGINAACRFSSSPIWQMNFLLRPPTGFSPWWEMASVMIFSSLSFAISAGSCESCSGVSLAGGSHIHFPGLLVEGAQRRNIPAARCQEARRDGRDRRLDSRAAGIWDGNRKKETI